MGHRSPTPYFLAEFGTPIHGNFKLFASAGASQGKQKTCLFKDSSCFVMFFVLSTCFMMLQFDL